MNLIISNKIIAYLLISCIFTLSAQSTQTQNITIHTNIIDEHTQEIFFTFNLTKKDFLYKDFIHFYVAHPSVQLSEYKANSAPITYYDPLFKNTKYIYPKSCTISVVVTAEKNFNESTYLYCTYYQRSNKTIKLLEQKLYFAPNPVASINNLSTTIDTDLDEHSLQIKNIGHKSLFKNDYEKIKTYAIQLIKTFTIPYSLHIFFVILLFILCIILPYFFTKKLHSSTQIIELITSIAATLSFIIINYFFYALHSFIAPYIIAVIVTLSTYTIGIFYIKKSTKLQWNSLRTLCNLIGIGLIAISVLLLFKAMQTISAVF